MSIERKQWRLRGDPHLWRERKAILGSTPYLSTEEQLTALIEGGQFLWLFRADHDRIEMLAFSLWVEHA
jgi:hypothetical protein